MIARIAIILAIALSASAQTATNRCAVDAANRAASLRDYIDNNLYSTTLGGWFPFMVSPTNSTTYASGDASRLRTTLEQTNTTRRPAWSTNGMTFANSNWLYSVGATTGMWYGLRCWVMLTNSITSTNSGRAIYSRRAKTAGQAGYVGFGSLTGLLTNETVTMMADAGDPWRVGLTNNITAGWHHLAVTWESTNYSIYLDGARPPHIYNVGISAGQTNNLEYWIGGIITTTGGMLNATVDDFALLTNSWSAAQIGADYTNGLRRRGL